MRDIEKYKRLIYYSAMTAETPIVDADGNLTGEHAYGYGAIVPLNINVSPPSGAIITKAFGKTINCDRLLFTCRKLPITPESVFWIDDLETNKPHDYEISGISDGMTATIYAVKKVNVS